MTTKGGFCMCKERFVSWLWVWLTYWTLSPDKVQFQVFLHDLHYPNPIFWLVHWSSLSVTSSFVCKHCQNLCFKWIVNKSPIFFIYLQTKNNKLYTVLLELWFTLERFHCTYFINQMKDTDLVMDFHWFFIGAILCD